MIDHNNFSIEQYDFDGNLQGRLTENRFAKGLWPLVYILSDERKKVAYVGETTDTFNRMLAHRTHGIKQKLTAVHLISSDHFNKSATLDIESNLIKYMSADKQFKLLNANLGIANHNYYQKTQYWDLFTYVWSDLQKFGIAKKSLSYIENLNLFKYSPYKSLSAEQNQGLIDILRSLAQDTHDNTLVEGGAGTGKSILAIFLFKLLCTTAEDLNFQEFGESEMEIVDLVQKIKVKRPNLKMALVIPMTSFRTTLQRVFRDINGLSSDMVIGPTHVAKKHYDLILVDEAHRLNQRKNIVGYNSYDKASNALGMDKQKNNQLDWMLQQSDKAVFFYDSNQSIKPSDVPKVSFDRLKKSPTTHLVKLKSQFRARGGNDYVGFVDKLLNSQLTNDSKQFRHKDYELKLFSSLEEMVQEVKARDNETGLSRLVAGFSWPWLSNPKNKNTPKWQPYDIIEDGIALRWNSDTKDWINLEGSEDEVGCIHTTQGYDLNYTGLIFGHEIGYDPELESIVIRKENYHDKNGRNNIKDPQDLVDYIINIYKTIMLRGIKGTYIYVCDPALREYMAQFIPLAVSETKQLAKVRILPAEDVKPYKNSVPLYDLTAAAGNFEEVQIVENFEWVQLPDRVTPAEDLFACRIVGESMNSVIPNGSICLFRKYHGGSRGGKIMLVQLSNFSDPDTGAAFSVKEYWSRKVVSEDGYNHREIILKPRSESDDYQEIIVTPAMAEEMKVLAEFEMVLGVSNSK
jgi:DUF2075 family protein/predicted GIY-YIG superfamily endonuclease